MARPLRCRLGIHKYVRRQNTDGQRYLECARCGKEYDSADRALFRGQ